MDLFSVIYVAEPTDDMYVTWGQESINKSLVGTMCLLSMLGCVTIMASFAAWRDIRTTSRKILLFLSVSDFLIAASNLVGIFIETDSEQKKKDNKCIIQSFFTNSVSISSFLWTLTLAIYLYLAIVKNKQSLGKRLLPFFHITNWFLGPVINWVALSQNMLGHAAGPVGGGWCWIHHDKSLDTTTHYRISNKEMMWIILNAKMLEIIVYPTSFVLYALIKHNLHRELKRTREGTLGRDVLESAKLADRKLIFVPLLLFMGRFWGILRCCLAFGGHTSKTVHPIDKALHTLQGIGDSSQGFLNCLFFCFLNLRVSNRIKGAILHYFCCQKRAQESYNYQGEVNVASVATYEQCSTSLVSSSDSTEPLLSKDTLHNHYGTQ